MAEANRDVPRLNVFFSLPTVFSYTVTLLAHVLDTKLCFGIFNIVARNE